MSNKINFTMQHQLQTNWCWAAVAASVASYYGAPSTQCDVANGEMQQNTCCQNGSSAACNQPWYLDRALTRVGHLAGAPSPGTLNYAAIRNEIDIDHPIGVRIGWQGGGGHFIVVSGYDNTSGQLVDVEDPWYSSSIVDYSVFAGQYQGSGAWTHSYPIA